MRTTVTLDADTEQAVRARMERDGVSFKQALNDAIRDGVQGPARPRAFVTRTYDMGRATVNIDKALQVASELEDAELVAKMRRGV